MPSEQTMLAAKDEAIEPFQDVAVASAIEVPFVVDPAELEDLERLTRKLSIEGKYQQLGGPNGFLGRPTSEDKLGARNGMYREFEGGSIYWLESLGAHEVHGDIFAKYKELLADNSFLGYPTTDVLKAPDEGAYSVFEGGAILLNPKPIATSPEFQKSSWAFEVHGPILEKYKALKAYAGILGYPTSDELDVGDGKGKFNLFDRGAIYWSPATGAHEVHGAIRRKYLEVGGPASFLGYPTSDEEWMPDKLGRRTSCQGGAIYWTPTTGAHEVHGAIRSEWQSMGAEQSWLGYPTSDEFTIPGANGRRSVFVGGAIDWYPDKGAAAIKHFYDLKAVDWCYELDKPKKNITFYAVVANAGTRTIAGPGELAIGVEMTANLVHTIVENPARNNKISPSFRLPPGQTTILGEGVKIQFVSNFNYQYLSYLFNIHGEATHDFCDPAFRAELATGKNNNGYVTLAATSGAHVDDPKKPMSGDWIITKSGKERYKLM